MKSFMDENFLLRNKTAETLYHDYAKEMPIFDFHCHLSPKEIAENKRYRNITEIWLSGDHYKWRAMRSNGVDERFITGDAPDKEKFLKWAETMTQCVGNPLYHWTQLELKRFFGIDELLSPQTADEIWEKCNKLLQKDEFTAQGLIKRSNVKAICTTDDPVDSLEYHIALAKNTSFGVNVLPAWRPDKSFNIDKDGFLDWIATLANLTGKKIKTVAAVEEALLQRLAFFHKVGCRVSDHALDPIVFAAATKEQVNAVFQKALQGEKLSASEVKQYKTHIMVFLGKQYARLGWVMQIHIGAIRNTNSRMMRLIGPDTGFDATADYTIAEPLAKFLNALDTTDELPKTVLYCLNPRDNDVLTSIAGCFPGSGIPGKMQTGSGWWYNDQKDGMIKQMTILANIGLLSLFIGMLTDSRSFLSYTRHEYFRRILCNMIGEWVENGETPHDIELLGAMVQNICFNNAKRYFGIDL
jgi:glucuronate isomerase